MLVERVSHVVLVREIPTGEIIWPRLEREREAGGDRLSVCVAQVSSGTTLFLAGDPAASC